MDVFQYLDPYLVFQNYYQSRKKYEPSFSYTVWSEELGVKSSSTLRMMVNGKKRLSMGLAERFARRQFQTLDEQNYFRLLVIYTHAPTASEKSAAWAALSKILSSRIEQVEALDFFTYVSDLIYPKLLTMLSFDSHKWCETSLAKALKKDTDQITQSLEKLEQSGMAVSFVSEDKKCWKATQRLVKIGDKLGDVALKAYHNASLDEAKEAQVLDVETRRYKSLLVPLSDEEFIEMTSEINAFTKQLISKYQSDHYGNRRLFKLNLNYFPVSEKLEF